MICMMTVFYITKRRIYYNYRLSYNYGLVLVVHVFTLPVRFAVYKSNMILAMM